MARPEREQVQWARVRAAVTLALGDSPHRDCFLHGVRVLLEKGFGRIALQYRAGRPVAARWRMELREREGRRGVPAYGREDWHCDDADLRGLHDLIFDGVESGELRIPTDASVPRKGDPVAGEASPGDLAALLAKWRQEAEEWSAKPGGGAALVAIVKDFRLSWVGVHVTRGPKGDIAQR